MIDEFVKFEDDTRSIHLVSNKSFDFGELKDTTETKNRSTMIYGTISIYKKVWNILTFIKIML